MPPEATPLAASTPAPVTPQKMGKFKTSRLIVSESWAILKQDKQLVVFPLISSVVALIAIGLLIIGYISVAPAGVDTIQRDQTTIAEYIFMLLYYVVVFFVANFFQTAMYFVINARFNNQSMSFTGAIQGAFQNIGKIFIWSLISATVGVILRAIADKSKILGQIVVSILGAAWGIMTYFSLLSLVIGKTTIVGSFKESAAIIRKTWGEVFLVNVGVGLFFSFIIVGVMFALIVLGFIIQDPIVFIALGVIFVLFVAVMSVISSTLGTIFKFALYEYGRSGKVISGFTPALVTNAFKVK